MTDTVVIYRWEFRPQTPARRVYAELELQNIGYPSERWVAQVYLVRDEMQRGQEVFDPDARVGMRIYVGLADESDADLSLLSYLAPVEGTRRAYPIIFNTLCKNPDKVKKFRDKWLIDILNAGGIKKEVDSPR